MLPVQTRSMHQSEARKINDQKSTDEIESNHKYDVMVTEGNNNSYHRDVQLIIVDKNLQLRAIKKKSKLFELDLTKYATNKTFPLEEMLLRLDKKSGIRNVTLVKWPLNDKIFTIVNITQFKHACNAVLKNFKIILNEPQKTITEKTRLMTMFHDHPIVGGHCGRNKLLAKLREKYYWKGISRDLAIFVKNCQKCRANKIKSATRQPTEITKTPQRAFDTIGPLQLSDSGNKYAVTMICDLTKYLVTAAVPDKSMKTIAKAIFGKFVLIYGPMRSIRSDTGTEYVNDLMTNLYELLKIEHKKSTAHHHESVGTIERNHRVFNEYIRSFVTDMSQWDVYLLYFYSNNSCFNDKYSPYELVFAKRANDLEFSQCAIEPLYNVGDYSREVKYRLQVSHDRARKILDALKAKIKRNYDKNVNPIELEIGDEVMLRNKPYNKHSDVYSGRFIVEKVDKCNVEIRHNESGKSKCVHKNRIIKK